MTRAPYPSPMRVEPPPDVYTVLIAVAGLVLVLTVGVSLYYLLAAPPTGCGLTFGELFGKLVPPGAGT